MFFNMIGSEKGIDFRNKLLAVIAAIFLLQITTAYGGDWSVEPRITIGETYTDNVTLSASETKQEEYITEISPGISLTGKGRRMELVLNYQLQKLLYAEENSRNNTNHQLQANANGELAKDHFFIESRASIGQQIISSEDGVAVDNLNIGNRAEVRTFGLSPYYKNDFGGYVDTLVRYMIDVVQFEEGATDSENHRTELDLSSGRKFARTSWGLRYSKENVIRETGEDIRYENLFGEIRYRLGKHVSALARAGSEQNDLGQTQTTAFENGDYWEAGLGWQPNTRFLLDMLYGDNSKSVDLNWDPTSRTSLQIGWRDRDVGLNPGSVWKGSFSLRTRRSNWQASYSEGTTTDQQLAGDFEGSVESDLQSIVVNDIFGLSDEISIRKRGQVSFAYNLKKSELTVSMYNEQREFQESDVEEIARGGSASYNWRISPRTNLIMGVGRQDHSFLATNREDKLVDYDLGLNRDIGRSINLSFTYSHLSRNSSDVSQGYEENRINFQALIRFI